MHAHALCIILQIDEGIIIIIIITIFIIITSLIHTPTTLCINPGSPAFFCNSIPHILSIR